MSGTWGDETKRYERPEVGREAAEDTGHADDDGTAYEEYPSSVAVADEAGREVRDQARQAEDADRETGEGRANAEGLGEEGKNRADDPVSHHDDSSRRAKDEEDLVIGQRAQYSAADV